MRNAKQILQGSLKDINDGMWICGELCTTTPTFEGEKVTKKDVMGCALGLVSIWGGDTVVGQIQIPGIKNPNYNDEFEAYYDTPLELRGNYPVEYLVWPRSMSAEVARYADSASPTTVIKAIKALYLATPKKYQSRWNSTLEASYDADEYINLLNEAVYNYNDSLKDKAKTKVGQTGQARRWFEKAIELVPTVDSKIKTAAMLEVEKADSFATAF